MADDTTLPSRGAFGPPPAWVGHIVLLITMVAAHAATAAPAQACYVRSGFALVAIVILTAWFAATTGLLVAGLLNAARNN